MTVDFLANEGGPGICVADRVEGRRFPLGTPHSVNFDPTDADQFLDPVDSAVSCQITELELPYVVAVFVRDLHGEMVAECHDFSQTELPDGEYELEIAAPIKIFVRVSGPMRVTSTNTDMRITFEEATTVEVGARSFHERPAATVTSTAAPEDLMAAVSTFGSALKTTSPERSFPLLRGYPPTIELGDTLDIPDAVEPPETDVRLEVPPDRAAVYAVATLAYYLGAHVTPGERARLIADGEVIRTLDGSGGIEGAVTETLKQIFLLDCVVRTEGRYQLNLHERRRLEEQVDLPLGDLYEAPIGERIGEYLDVPPEEVLNLAPTWTLSTHLSPAPNSAEQLAYAANALSLISVERREVSHSRPAPPEGYDELIRSTEFRTERPEFRDEPRYVRVPESGALERAWVGDGRSINANDLHPTGFRNRLAEASTEGPINIAIVCNDEQMVGEIYDGTLYGNREEIPFEVTVHRNISRGEFRNLLAKDIDFLHYVGHVERAGFVCRDGTFDASELDDVGVDTFLLNGCRSYDQGTSLIESGSVGGIVTHGAVANANATAVGQLVAGLLDAGFSLRSALTVAGRRHSVEGRYTVIGDGGIQVAQSKNGTPNLLTITRDTDAEEYEVQITTYPTRSLAIGTSYTPYAPSVDRFFLTGGDLPPLELSLPEIVNILALERVPTIVDGDFRWSTDVSPSDLP